MTAEEALDIAVDHIKSTYGETDASLRRFELFYGFTAQEEPNLWMFSFDTHDAGGLYVDGYDIYIDARTGDVTGCWGFHEGHG